MQNSRKLILVDVEAVTRLGVALQVSEQRFCGRVDEGNHLQNKYCVHTDISISKHHKQV